MLLCGQSSLASLPLQVASCPILVLGNKIDKPNALSEDQLKWHVGIQHMCTGKG